MRLNVVYYNVMLWLLSYDKLFTRDSEDMNSFTLHSLDGTTACGSTSYTKPLFDSNSTRLDITLSGRSIGVGPFNRARVNDVFSRAQH